MNIPATNQPRPTLIIIDGSGSIQQHDIYGFRKPEITIGRSSEKNDIVIGDSFVSGRHGTIISRGDSFYYADENSSNGSLVTAASRTRFLKQETRPVELGNNSVIRIGSARNPDKRVLIWFTYIRGEEQLTQMEVGEREISIGRAQNCDIVLNHPSVSRLHARITIHGDQWGIRDCGSANGVLINGERLLQPTRLLDKDVIQISGYQLILSGNHIYYKNRISGIGITARGINKYVGGRNAKKQILRNADVKIDASEFVAIIGGSGAGKSTIMNVLNGFDRSYHGEVYYNNISLNDNFQSLKSIIGYVPQEDIIYENLTLRKMLQYTAKLRMPKDVDKAEAEAKIDEVLQTLDLVEHQNTLIRKMSGGQKKRASIAVELLADPKLFFLDEPTSGLDPGTEKNLMMSMQRLCKEQERTIVMVTHTTQSLHLCDKVIFMGPGGRVCFVGNVEEAKKFFENDDLTEIYNIIAQDPAHWERKFRHMDDRAEEEGGGGENEISRYRRGKSSPFRQFTTLVARYSELILNDRRKLLILMLEPIVIGLLLYIVAGDNVFDVFNMEDPRPDDTPPAVNAYNSTKSIMFTLSCAAIWIGLFNSIQEICKERSILKREYMANLRLPVYMGSKVVVQAVIGAIQAVLLSLTFLLMVDKFKNDGEVDVWHEELETLFDGKGIYPEIMLTVWITILASMALGLIVSSIVKTGDKAMVVAPFLLIVQLLFSGFLFKLEGISELIANVTVSKWSVDSLCRIANLGSISPDFEDMINDDLDTFAWDVGELLQDWGILILMTLICIVISTILLRSVAKDGR